MKINLLVIRTEKPEILKTQYEQLGFQFDYHKHGNGPYHYASELNGAVFEIYPLTKSMTKADGSLRLGFEVNNLESMVSAIQNTDWNVLSEISKTEWGTTSVI